jgi:hypothetical protein
MQGIATLFFHHAPVALTLLYVFWKIRTEPMTLT